MLKTKFTKSLSFNKICIVGVGLIGGSIGLAIKSKKLTRFVIGVARREKTLREAFKRKAIDVGTLDLKQGVEDADLVILAGPVSTIVSQLKVIQKFLKKGALVIDVGSSKELIERTAKKQLKKNIFVGCHPMAGLEKKGVLFAQADLFDGTSCFVTARNAKVEQFWKRVGCIPVPIKAHEHDAWVAQFSHLPHVLAFALFQTLPKGPGSLKATNPSLRDLARISKSDPKLWLDILSSNKRQMLGVIARFQKDLDFFEKAIRSNRASEVMKFIATANRVSQRTTVA